MEINKIICGDSLSELKKLPPESIDCVITSPPYWGLRDYGVSGQLGLEKTPEEYVAKMVEIFREVKRVLKKEGTLWLNLGDTYSAQRWTNNPGTGFMIKGKNRTKNEVFEKQSSLPDKNIVGIPWRIAFALQRDGWILRQDIIWAKPNPMPESVTDRCTKSHEYVFLLTKGPKYYFDNEAIKEPHAEASIKRANYGGTGVSTRTKDMTPPRTNQGWNVKELKYNFENGRNRRSVWTITTKPFKDAHFATFPEDLIVPMILAGTSEKGVCPDCEKAWERKLEKKPGTMNIRVRDAKKGILQKKSGFDESATKNEISNYGKEIEGYTKTLGWQPTCKCGKKPIPAVVLDPFIGSGTTAVVAKKLGRNYLGIELNPKYVKMAEERIRGQCAPLF